MNSTGLALQAFTQRFCHLWQQKTGHDPQSDALYGIPSPCIRHTGNGVVFWQPCPFTPDADLTGVERAMDIRLMPEIHTFYTTQYAGDMPAILGNTVLELLQPWSQDDFRRVQENLIGHLVTQRRLKLSPTLFIATTEDDREVMSVCNLTGRVLLEKLGTAQRETVSDSLPEFLDDLHPFVIN